MAENDIASKVAVTSVTYFRKESEVDMARSRLALGAIREARTLGYPVFIVDGGSYDGFLENCEREGANITLQPEASFPQRTRLSIEQAYNAPNLNEVLLRMEIEKTPLVSQIEKMALPILNGEADFVVPHRGNLESYPPEQRHAERLGDLWFKALTGLEEELDMWGGTRVWRRDLTKYFLDETIDGLCIGYQGKPNNWAHYFVPVLRIIKDGHRVQSVPIDFTYPKEQAALESGDFSFVEKRLIQLVSITEALRSEWERINSTTQRTSKTTY